MVPFGEIIAWRCKSRVRKNPSWLQIKNVISGNSPPQVNKVFLEEAAFGCSPNFISVLEEFLFRGLGKMAGSFSPAIFPKENILPSPIFWGGGRGWGCMQQINFPFMQK
jgi:hypothetical protein